MTSAFSPEFIDALIDAIDHRRAVRLAPPDMADTPQALPSSRRLLEREAERSLMAVYRSARRALSIDRANAVIDLAERRIARLKSQPRPNPSRRHRAPSAQELAEIFRVGFAGADHEERVPE